MGLGLFLPRDLHAISLCAANDVIHSPILQIGKLRCRETKALPKITVHADEKKDSNCHFPPCSLSCHRECDPSDMLWGHSTVLQESRVCIFKEELGKKNTTLNPQGETCLWRDFRLWEMFWAHIRWGSLSRNLSKVHGGEDWTLLSTGTQHSLASPQRRTKVTCRCCPWPGHLWENSAIQLPAHRNLVKPSDLGQHQSKKTKHTGTCCPGSMSGVRGDSASQG